MTIIRVQIDCEFTDFINCDLISIGCAADNGDEFYGENADFNRNWSSAFVRENIYPLLHPLKYSMSRMELSNRLWSWLEELPCDEVIISYDYQGDYDLFCKLFYADSHPKISSHQNIFANMYKECDDQVIAMGGNDDDYQNLVKKVRATFDLEVIDYFLNTKEIQHHALSDAKANRAGYTKIVNKFGIPR